MVLLSSTFGESIRPGAGKVLTVSESQMHYSAAALQRDLLVQGYLDGDSAFLRTLNRDCCAVGGYSAVRGSERNGESRDEMKHSSGEMLLTTSQKLVHGESLETLNVQLIWIAKSTWVIPTPSSKKLHELHRWSCISKPWKPARSSLCTHSQSACQLRSRDKYFLLRSSVLCVSMHRQQSPYFAMTTKLFNPDPAGLIHDDQSQRSVISFDVVCCLSTQVHALFALAGWPYAYFEFDRKSKRQ